MGLIWRHLPCLLCVRVTESMLKKIGVFVEISKPYIIEMLIEYKWQKKKKKQDMTDFNLSYSWHLNHLQIKESSGTWTQ